MSIAYLDTSAFLKLVVQEPSSDDVRAAVTNVELWSSTLLAVEAHRAALRLGIPPEEVDHALAAVTLVVPSETTFMTARSIGTADLRTLAASMVESERGNLEGAVAKFDPASPPQVTSRISPSSLLGWAQAGGSDRPSDFAD